MVGRRLTVAQAAEVLGVSANAVRMRVRRGSLASEKDAEGRVWVLVEASVSDQHATNQQTNEPTNELVDELRDRLRFVEGQLEAEREAHREARRIIAGLVQRVPELTAGETSEVAAEGDATQEPNPEPGSVTENREQGSERRSWWSRLLRG